MQDPQLKIDQEKQEPHKLQIRKLQQKVIDLLNAATDIDQKLLNDAQLTTHLERRAMAVKAFSEALLVLVKTEQTVDH